MALKAEKIAELDEEIAFEEETLKFQERRRARQIEQTMATLKDLRDQKAELTGISKDEKHMQEEFASLKEFFKRASSGRNRSSQCSSGGVQECLWEQS